MSGDKVIDRISVGRLLGHPENPNRMSKKSFVKLVGHIKESGDYEPVIVRRHKVKEGFYEILNGHHRVKVLRELGYEVVDCVVWEVSDERARMLLATLNRLNGSDDVDKRAELINRLSEKFSVKELAGSLPETREAIERLKTISNRQAAIETQSYEIPETLVFIVSSEQKAFIEKVIDEAAEPGKGANDAQRRAWAVVEILRYAKL